MPKKTPDVFEGGHPSLKLAMCQVHTEPWDLDGNLERTLESLDEAARQGAEFAITPECVLHGYPGGNAKDFKDKLIEASQPLDGEKVAQVRQAAKDNSLDVMFGFAELGDEGRLHNTAALISREGEIVNVYRKVHCRPFEDIRNDGMFTPGDEFWVERVEYGGRRFSIGAMICFDREIPETVRCLRALGAQFIACPLACNTNDMNEFADSADNEMVTRCRAAENEVFIAVVNHAGRFNGGSFVVGPGGELLAQMDKEPSVLTLDVPIGAIPPLFHDKPLGWMGWGHRRREVYGKYL